MNISLFTPGDHVGSSSHAAMAKAVRGAFVTLLIAFALGSIVSSSAFAAKWDSVDAADLAAKDSKGFPGTDAEILIATLDLSQRVPEVIGGGQAFDDLPLVFVADNFVRAKIYTDKGVQDQSKFSIQYGSSSRLTNTAARVVKPDGSSIELTKSDFIKNVLAKDEDGSGRNEIAFVFPGLAPGDVIEYRWTEQTDGKLISKVFVCQNVVPTRESRFRIGKMAERGTVGSMNLSNATSNNKDGYELVVRDQPAFEKEEHIPPELDVRGWIYMAKTYDLYPKDSDIWQFLNELYHDDFNRATKPGSAIKKKAEALIAGASTDDEKLQRLYDFCQKEIFNTTYRTTAELQAGIDDHKEYDAFAPAKILDRGRGRKDEINLLFAALARGLGFEARPAYNASRYRIINMQIPHAWAFLKDWPSVAVKLGEKWSYFCPGDYFAPFGLLPIPDEGATAMLCNSGKTEMVKLPGSRADQSQAMRKARLTLDAEGTLEGDVEETFTGHMAEERKMDARLDSIEQTSKDFREAKTKLLPNADVSDITWTNLETCLMPLTVKYHVRVPGYAQLAGKRIIFAPSFFQAGQKAVFAAAERKFPIYFYYPRSEHDDIEIVLPAGYTLEKPSAPAPVGNMTGGFGAEYKMQYQGKTRTFGYRRDFVLGADGSFAFAKQAYPALKALFEQRYKSDTHSIVIKPKAAPVAQAIDKPAEGEKQTPAATP